MGSPPKSELVVDAWSADVGCAGASPEEFVEQIVKRVQSSWEEGADLVVLPEFLWVGLERWVGSLPEVAHHFKENVWPQLQENLSLPNKAVVLGTVPWMCDHAMRNRAFVLVGGQVFTQDKLCLTPWEKAFGRGSEVQVMDFLGWRLSVLICLDVEIPDHCVRLRKEKLDLLLVPSATETLLGTERIARCASARAVEIGCYVVVTPLVGKCESELIDENVGRISCYCPSQGAFHEVQRTDEGPVIEIGWEKRRFRLSHSLLRVTRRNFLETNPASVFPA